MARSFTNIKAISSLVSQQFSNTLARRGYAATAQSAAGRGVGVSMSGPSTPKSGQEKVGVTEKVAWVPDPVTGYYKPENIKEVVDVAELRATVLGEKLNH